MNAFHRAPSLPTSGSARFVLAGLVAAVSLLSGCPAEVDGLGVAPECRVGGDCGDDEVCAEGDCVASPECLSIDDWPFCREALNELEADLGRTAICDPIEGTVRFRCLAACEIDSQCPAGNLCTDFGRCRADFVRATPGIPAGTHATLQAGVGEALLDVPATTSLGGLSSRAGPGDGRWADGMDPAVGNLEGLWARAAYLDVGDGRLLTVRLPIIFPTGALTEAIAQRLQDATGEDWRDALLVNATHTHSGPARFLPLLGESEAVLGPFGIGTFRQEIFDLIADAAAASALAAIESQGPAKLGWTIVEDFDSDDAIAVDRRTESPQFDDNRALLVRVDDDAGLPLFVLTSFGVHLTENGHSFANNDVAGGVEDAIEEAMFEVAGRVVPAMFLNSNGGTMAPTAGSQGFPGPMANRHAGEVFIERVGDALRTLETRADITLKSRVHRMPVTAPLVGYEPGEWRNGGTPPFGGEVTYGGLNCFLNVDDDVEPFDAHLTREQMGCGISFHTFLFNHPPTVFQRTQIHAVEIDGLHLVTLPGELSMELAWGISASLQRRFGLDPLETFTLGYTGDHLMYLLPTSLDEDAPPWPGYDGPAPNSFPPFAFSPLRGGFEADTSIWGDRMGDYLIAETELAWERLENGTPSTEEIAPPVFTVDAKAPIPIDDVASARLGTILVDMPATLARRVLGTFTFVGGDIGIEGRGPAVQVETEAGEVVRLPSGRPFSTEHTLFPLTFVREQGEWHYSARFEAPIDLPLGRYRLSVRGDAQVDGATVGYTLESAVFEVVGATLEANARREGNDLLVSVAYENPAAQVNGERLQGPLRLLDHRVRPGTAVPIPEARRSGAVATATPSGGTPISGTFVGSTSEVRFVDVGSGSVDVSIADALGNSVAVAVPAADPEP